ncbi:methionine ABC transporter permease [Dictyobacter arantiisoli]|uniref:Metal ABC transporter permease n=1 Tax=Dictyobacter arantiisoli TaxID=2014874 RepID=A0A5A5TII0_9CHLR|nr:methionine ABC transporter permease [Dictyobacter arantiisoli]GCF11410.1 metal ABC transporter permease [Dictyobacter arantiisoli]
MDWSYWSALLPDLWQATQDTAQMVVISTIFTIIGGLLLGILLVITDRDGLVEVRWLHAILGFIVNVGRSLPFIILLVAITPFTRLLVGTTIGTTAAIVPLTIAAIPFFARLAESSLREVDNGVVEAARAMGCNGWQIIVKVLVPEALPSLILGVAVTIISLIGYSAIAGAVGAGGLGDLAIQYGYERFDTGVMVVTVVLLVVIVQIIQFAGSWGAAKIARH